MTLFPNYDEYMEERAAESQQSYELRLLKQLYGTVFGEAELSAARSEAGDEFSFAWFNDNVALPIKLCSSMLKTITVDELLRSEGMPKTKAWKEYFQYKTNYPKSTLVGMVFQLKHMSQWIMHNWPALPAISGINKIIRRAVNPDNALVIEPYKAFCRELAVWHGK